MGGWKRLEKEITPTNDCFFYELEEIDEEDLFKNPRTKSQKVEVEELDSFINIDDFVEPEHPDNTRKKKLKILPTEVVLKEQVADQVRASEEGVDNNTECRILNNKVYEDDEGMNPQLLAQSEWHQFNLHPQLIQALLTLNFSTPTEIQQKTLGHSITEHKDIIGAAETGSGKTLAFGLPILNSIVNTPESDGVKALILVPTRELAMQVCDHLKTAGKTISNKIVAIVGGMATVKQVRLLKKVPDIIIATPGRLWSLLEEDEKLARDLTSIRFLVLDEADRMLEAGHFKHLDDIIEKISVQKIDLHKFKRQTFVFSATMLQDNVIKQNNSRKAGPKNPISILFRNLLEKIEFRDKEPTYVNLSREQVTAQGILESKIDCLKTDKDLMLYYVLCRYTGKTIVFVNSIDAIRRLVPILSYLKPNVFGIHAEMQQKQRLKNLERFKSIEDAVLIASDVASRGLDIPLVNHVIHYQLPRAADIYVHRAGRTGRAGLEGVSVMLCAPEEQVSLFNKVDGIIDFPVDFTISSRLKQRVTLARQLDQLEHKNKKLKNDVDWFKKAAEEADIMMSDESDTETANEVSSKHRANVAKLKAELSDMLKVSLIPKGYSTKYLTSNVNPLAAEIAISSKGNILPTVNSSQATDDLRVRIIADCKRRSQAEEIIIPKASKKRKYFRQ